MELTLDQALQKGIEAHKAGKVQEADRYYTAILKANPKHPDANHNMGVLAVGVGKVLEALPFFKTALEINPNIVQFWLSYIDALIKLDRMDEARAAFDQAKSHGVQGDGLDKIEERLGFSDGKNLNAQEPSQQQLQPLINLSKQGKYQEAQTQALQMLKQFPTSFGLYNIIGAANQRSGNLNEAIEAYSKALSIKPDFAEAYNNMGIVLKDQGKLEEAIKSFNNAISINPRNAQAYYNKGIALKEQGKLEEAIEAYNKAVSIKADYFEAYNNKGIALKDQGKLKNAIAAYNKALSIKPNHIEAWCNGAEALEKWNKLDQLEIWIEKGLEFFEIVPADLMFMKSKLLWRNNKFNETAYSMSY